LDLLQQDLVDEGHEVIYRRVGLGSTVFPPATEVDLSLQPQLLEQAPNRAEIPLFFIGISLGLGINYRTPHTGFFEALHGAQPQAGFAHLAAVRHKAIIPSRQVLIEVLIGAAHHIAGKVGAQAAAGLVVEGGGGAGHPTRSSRFT
jgi:hypothetical protein